MLKALDKADAMLTLSSAL